MRPGGIASLPWYDLPETRPWLTRLWKSLSWHMSECGLSGVPARLNRRLSVPHLFCHRRLMFGQCCGYDLVYGYSGCVQLVATPVFSAPGCEGPRYRSLVIVRKDCPATDIGGLRGGVCILNSYNSHSGTNALREIVAPLSRNGRFFSRVIISGGHINSLAALLAHRGDVMAMDCVMHELLRRHRPAALDETRVMGCSSLVPAPPYITSAATTTDAVEALRNALMALMADNSCRTARDEVLLGGIRILPLQSYRRILEVEGAALRHNYTELHATASEIMAGR